MKVKLRLDTLSDVRGFVELTKNIDNCSITLEDGTGLVVNGRSLLGAIYTLEWNEIYCKSDADIYRMIEEYIITE